ncbi:MAG: tetratricopeptide repeat protein, partial [Bacteroidales bacterium]|nr:tetratricopeptide repeat protein [Bacteroidales bacterium]
MKKFFIVLAAGLLSVGSVFAQKQKTITDYFNDGIRSYRMGSYKEAIVSFNKVLELNPKFTEAYGNLGNAKFRLGDYKGAKDAYDIVLSKQSKDFLTYYNRAV